MAMTFHALTNDFAAKYVECREQGRHAVATSAPLLHRQSRLGAVEGLDLALLVNRQDHRVVWWIDVEAHYLLELGCKLRIIGELKVAYAMWPKTMRTPYPLHRADAYPNRLGHRRARPVTGSRRRAGQRQGYDAHGYCRIKGRDARPARLVAPKTGQPFIAKPFLPSPDHGLSLARGTHDLGSATSLRRQENNLSSPNVLLRAVAVRHHRFEGAAVGGSKMEIRSFVHSGDSHMRVSRGNPRENRTVRLGPLGSPRSRFPHP